MTYDYKTLEERMKKLSPEVQEAMTSVEITNAIKKIAEKSNLKLDQEEILYEQTAYVMLGLSPARNFVRDFSQEAGVDTKTASAIAEDINKEVFAKIRLSMRTFEEKSEKAQEVPLAPSTNGFGQLKTPAKTVDDLSMEQAGGFSLEREPVESHTPMTDSKESIMSHIENPERADVKPATPAVSTMPVPPKVIPKTTPHTDAIMDHLLGAPSAMTEQKIIQKPEIPENSTKSPIPNTTNQAAPKTPPPIRKVDTYREPIQ